MTTEGGFHFTLLSYGEQGFFYNADIAAYTLIQYVVLLASHMAIISFLTILFAYSLFNGVNKSRTISQPVINNSNQLTSFIVRRWIKYFVHIFSDPPLITLKMGRTLNPDDIKEGDDVYFECHIKANPKIYKKTWYHNVSRRTFINNSLACPLLIHGREQNAIRLPLTLWWQRLATYNYSCAFTIPYSVCFYKCFFQKRFSMGARQKPGAHYKILAVFIFDRPILFW